MKNLDFFNNRFDITLITGLQENVISQSNPFKEVLTSAMSNRHTQNILFFCSGSGIRIGS